MKTIIRFIFICLIFCSCVKNDLRHIQKMINEGDIEKVEILINENKIDAADLPKVRELLFNHILADIVMYAKRSEIEKIKIILNEQDFSQEQYNLICEKIFNVFNSYNYIFDLIETKLPADTYCFDDSLLMCAVKSQNVDAVNKLLLKGADTSKRNKKGQYNALFLSISFCTEHSFEIFKELLQNTDVTETEVFSFPKETYISGWYFEQIIKFNQKEMMDFFLQHKDVIEIIENNVDTLKIIVKNSNAYDLVPDYMINSDLIIDDTYEYFLYAVVNLNYRMIPILVQKNIQLYCDGEGEQVIMDFINYPKSRRVGMFELDRESENYEKTIALSPMIKAYYEKWKTK